MNDKTNDNAIIIKEGDLLKKNETELFQARNTL